MTITAASRMEFCRRCGDPVGASQSSSSSCKRCGGAGVEARVRSSEPPSSKQRADPWASRYVAGSLASTSPPPSPGRASSSVRPASVSFPTSRTAPLSLGVPSSISRDLRAPVTPRTQGTRTLSDASAPLLKAPDGGLSKVVGSLVEPTESRAQWACAGCESQFARDATLFIAPGTSNTFYCRDCYASRHALGVCPGCARRVLGLEKEEGKFIRAGEDVWHGRCWICPCGVTKDVLRGVDGMPVCDDCFDKPRERRPVPGAAPKVLPSSQPNQNQRASTSAAALRGLSGASSRNTALGPSIDALTKRFASTSVGGATAIPSPTPSPLLAPQRTGSPTRAPPPAWGAPPSSPTRRVTLTFPAPRSRANSGSTSPIIGILPSRSSGSVRGASLSRNGSLSGSPPKAPRPLTAQFTGEAFNLAAFQSAQGGLMRHDSRSRSVSPSKRDPVGQESDSRTRTTSGFPLPANASLRSKDRSPTPSSRGRSPARSQESDPSEAVRCAICHKSPWDGTAPGSDEVNMLVIRGAHVHPRCFKCHVCALSIEGTKSFVRLEDEPGEEEAALGRFAHPACAPPATVARRAVPPPATTGPTQHRNLSHATHQPAPRPSLDPAPAPRAPVHSFLTSSSAAAAAQSQATTARPGSAAMSASNSAQSSSSASSVRRFQPTNGAAPPTRSTLDVRPSMASNNKAAGIFASSINLSTATAPAAGAASPVLGSMTGRKLGGLNPCAGCGLKLSPLESVPGPRGTVWHQACLRCSGVKPGPPGSYGVAALPRKCGKQLDSAAKVDELGQVRCSACASVRKN